MECIHACPTSQRPMNRSVELAGNRVRSGAGDNVVTDDGRLDGASFATLYERHLPDIYSYVRARTGREEDAADLAQQVFTQALIALPRYRAQGIPVNIWLFRIAHNLVVDFHRRKRPTVSWDVLPSWSHPPSRDNVEATVIGREDIERLGRTLARLEADKRDLLALRFAAGLTVREIAAVLGRRDAAVRSELRRLLRALHEEFSHE